MPAMTVFSETIRCLVGHMLTECNRRKEDNEYVVYQRADSDEHKRMERVERDDIFWVLTVPAIWDDSAKQFMREAAVNVSSYFIFELSVCQLWSVTSYCPRYRTVSIYILS